MPKKKFYITTPIYYTNAEGHIGHAYTTIMADVVARYKRLQGFDVFFLTGTDEHGAKIAEAAIEKGKPPKEFCDEIVESFKQTWKNLGISNDYFVRTTDERHEKSVHKMLLALKEKGDVFEGKYEGLYCKGCEKFITEKDLEDGKCPLHLKAPEKLVEDDYFFKLSKYQDRVKELISSDKLLVEPLERKNEVLSFLENEKLQDIAISRKTVEWGLKIPWDNSHSCYVWIEALWNYASSVGYEDNSAEFKKFWPADLQFMAKDILRFHAVIWPAMLLALGLPTPKRLFVHGYFTVNGQKMSKSLGNVVNPNFLVQKYGSDTVRYFLCREIPFGQDGDFSEIVLGKRLNNELANDLGNLVSRVLALLEKSFAGKIPKGKSDSELENFLNLKKIDQYMENLELHLALAEIWQFVNSCNKYVNEKEPWKLQGKDLDNVLYSLADSIRVLAIILQAFIPSTSEKIFQQLGIPTQDFSKLKFGLLEPGTQTKKEGILFTKLDLKQVEESIDDFPWLEFERSPGVEENSVLVQVNGLRVKSKSQELERFKKDFLEKLDISKLSKSAHVELYRKDMGEKDRGKEVSVDNLLKQFSETKKLPNINTVADAYNLKSLEYGIVLGAYDRQKISGKVFLRKASGQEKFTIVGSKAREKIFPGEEIYLDSNNEVITRLLSKQSEHSKVTLNTRTILMCFQGNSKMPLHELKKIAQETVELIVKFCGGKYKFLN
ncbi:MAG: methionine--tRNA ligase [Candidatus Diapherotrites archaeon]|nr:methionine--tRNA ligase [Candidatus Diapherotrites archaeon]